MAEGLRLLPPAANKCQECAVEHAANQPHDATSLFYQMRSMIALGRESTWLDAMAHCSQGTQKAWKAALGAMGVDVDAGDVRPRRR